MGLQSHARNNNNNEKKHFCWACHERRLIFVQMKNASRCLMMAKEKSILMCVRWRATEEWVQTETNLFEWVERKCKLPAIVRNTFFFAPFVFVICSNAIYLTRTHTMSSGWVGSVLLCVALKKMIRIGICFYERQENEKDSMNSMNCLAN